MATTWRVVYTKHKVQKRKVWQDGFLEVSNRKVLLFADEDGCPSKSAIDEMFLSNQRSIESGSVIELPGFLVDPDDIIDKSEHQKRSLPKENVNPHFRSSIAKHNSKIEQRFSEHGNVKSQKFRLPSTSGQENSRVNLVQHLSSATYSQAMTVSRNRRQRFQRFEVKDPVFLGAKSCLDELCCLDSKCQRSASTLSFPNTYTSSNEYISTFRSALIIEINCMLFDAASAFCHQYWRITNIESAPFKHIHEEHKSRPRCAQHSTLCLPRTSTVNCTKSNSQTLYCPLRQCSNQYSKSNAQSVLPAVSNITIALDAHHKRAAFFQKTDLLYYATCQLIRQFPKQPGSNVIIRNESRMRLFLRLPEKKAPASAFSLYDCWIVSNSPSFEAEDSKFWIIIAFAKYHCPSKSGMLEIQLFPGMKSPAAIRSQGSHENLFAMMVGNIQSEIIMLDRLESLKAATVDGLFRYVQNPSQSILYGTSHLEVQLSPIQILEHFVDICQEFRLNPEQKAVLNQVQSWMDPDCRDPNPVVLVHGVFGAGKSHLLAAIVMFLSRVFTGSSQTAHRILIASLTNVAVDRILLCLKDHGFTDFARVGSVKKIAKPILKNVLHWSENSGDEEGSDRTALSAYREMLNDPELTGSDRAYVNEAYNELLAQRTQQRADQLKNMLVVGVTCASSVVEVLSGTQFSVVLLDECSQMTEPMSLLPITNFNSCFSVLVGDPMQLPPTLRSTTGESTKDLVGLKKTLFVRLQQAGLHPTILTRQYRCHPALSRICNELFYSKQLQDGCLPSDRSAIIPGLPPIAFIDVSNCSNQAVAPGGSFYNPGEVSVICKILKQIASFTDSENFTIGIIALYKSQEYYLRNAVSELNCKSDINVQISTVDAFQGSEKDIILLSTVRSSGIGFLNCPYRLNVALSRAKRHMIVVGSSPVLQNDALWRNVVQYAKWVAGQTPPFQFEQVPEIQRKDDPSPFVFPSSADEGSNEVNPFDQSTANPSFENVSPIPVSDSKYVEDVYSLLQFNKNDTQASASTESKFKDQPVVQNYVQTFDQEEDPWSWMDDIKMDELSNQLKSRSNHSTETVPQIDADNDIDDVFAL